MQPKTEQSAGNRWAIAVAGIVMQIALGAVYAWSVFRKPLESSFGWSTSEVTWAFSITILTLGIAAFFGGLWMARVGPRVVGVTGGVLYGLGVFLASFSADRLLWLYFSYGLLGGVGIGLGYIVPVATLVKWFPDRRGFITGLAVAGFGAGALVTAPVATALIGSVGVLRTFAYLGVAYLVLTVGAALCMRNPPAGYRPPGWNPSAAASATADFTLGGALRTWQWYALWALLFLNVTAGISIISQAAPMAQEIAGIDAAMAAAFAGLLGIPNGLGRFLWSWLSDLVGRRWVFLAMFLAQAAVFLLLPRVASFGLFAALTVVVLLCYGGGFGTLPAFAADYFGTRNVGPIYGLMLTAWGLGGVLGPLLIANIRESSGGYGPALLIIGGIMLASALVPLFVRPPRAEPQPTPTAAQEPSAETAREREVGGKQ
ncbi:MAG TPA: OFA family MFS transporter [Roseiflexaceae bacterium]|nr:OFA family MFS transporter [Roseiflexaceae bacterium]